MHTVDIMKSDDFSFLLNGKESSIDKIFKGFNEHDRVGVIVSKPSGLSGTSALLLATITRFYDFFRPDLGDGPGQLRIYPDYFIFHIGKSHMDGFFMDIWPPHKEVIVEDDPEQILEAINDRGITRLIVEDREPVEGIFLKETLASGKLRIRTATAYSPTGRVRNGNIEVRSCEGAEEMAIASINESKPLSTDQQKKLIEQREELAQDGRIIESYRSVDVDKALNMLTDHNIQSETTRKYFDML